MTHLFGVRINGIEGDNDPIVTGWERMQYLTLILVMALACLGVER